PHRGPRGMTRVLLRAPAKLNLRLEVGPVRDDGYHPLRTLMVALHGLHDDVTVARADIRSVECPGVAERENLAWRIVDALAAEAGPGARAGPGASPTPSRRRWGDPCPCMSRSPSASPPKPAWAEGRATPRPPCGASTAPMVSASARPAWRPSPPGWGRTCRSS